MTCPTCGHRNPAGSKFCLECGSAQSAQQIAGGAAHASPAARPSDKAEVRKVVTIVCADIHMPATVQAVLAARIDRLALCGEPDRAAQEQRTALHLYTKLGASGHAERVSRQLSAISGRQSGS